MTDYDEIREDVARRLSSDYSHWYALAARAHRSLRDKHARVGSMGTEGESRNHAITAYMVRYLWEVSIEAGNDPADPPPHCRNVMPREAVTAYGGMLMRHYAKPGETIFDAHARQLRDRADPLPPGWVYMRGEPFEL